MNINKILGFVFLLMITLSSANAIERLDLGTTQTNYFSIGYSSSFYAAAQRVIFPYDVCIEGVNLYFYEVGTGTDINITLETDNFGSPSGTDIETDNEINILASELLGPSYNAFNRSFSSCINVTANTPFWVKVDDPSTYSTTNWARVGVHYNSPNYNSSSYAMYTNGASWLNATNPQFLGSIYYSIPTVSLEVNILNITANDVLLTNNSYFNVSDIDFNVTYEVLNSGIGDFTNSSITSLVNQSEGVYAIQFEVGYNNTNATSGNYTYTIDLTAPSISIIGPITQDFEVNFSTIFNVTDSLSGLASCTINITYLENVTNASQYNKYINCTDTTTFGAAGLYNGYITATDNAGNIATLSINGTIQPFVYVNFINIYSENITNYDVNIYHPSGVITSYTNLNNPTNISPIYNGSLDLGTYTLEVTREGYVRENFTLDINETSGGETFNFTLTLVTLTIKAYDINSLTQINFTVTIENSTNSTTFTNQYNFSKLYNETPTGTVTITISATSYDNSEYILTLNPYTSVSLNAYLYATNSTAVHQFTVLETSSGLALGGVSIEVQQEINSTWTTIGTKLTGSNGKTYFYLSTANEYKVIFSKDGYVTATSNTIPTVKEYTVKLTTTAGAYEYVDDVSYSFKPTATLLNDNNTYSFQAFISGSSFTSTSINIILSNGTIIYSGSSTNPTGTTYSYDYYIPYLTNLTGVTMQLIYLKDGDTFTVTKDYTIISFTNTSFLKTLEEYGTNTDQESKLTVWLLLMIGTAALIITGALMGINSISLFIIPFWALASFVGWIEWIYAGVVIFISLVIAIGGRK